MELSDPLEALGDPFGSSPLSDPTIILGDTEVEASSPNLPYSGGIVVAVPALFCGLSGSFLCLPGRFEILA
jgi:hypothetical protein